MNKKVINNLNLDIVKLFLGDFKLKQHGREIAKKLKANQRTVLLHLNKLEEDNILNSKIKGRNKEFFLNMKNEITKYFIILSETQKAMGMLDDNFKIYSIAEKIRRKTEGIALIYGSYAKGYANQDSDLDILIVGKVSEKYKKDIKRMSPLDVHIVELSKNGLIKGIKKNEPFIQEIIQNHVIIQGIENFTKLRIKYGQN